MNASAQAIGNGPAKKVPEWAYGLGVAFWTLLVLAAFPYYFQAMWPPAHNSYGLVSLLPISLTAMAFWRSSQTNTYGRVLYAPAACLGLFFAGKCYENYLWMYGDYPWLAAFPLTLGVFVGAWFARQKWIMIALLGFLAWWFAGALKPSALGREMKQSAPGVTVQLLKVSADACELQMTEDSRYQPVYVHVGAHCGSIPIHAGQAHSRFDEKDHYFASIRAPKWAQSLDLDVTIPLLPATSASRWTVNLSGKAPTVTIDNGVENMQIHSFKWADAEHRTLGFLIRVENPLKGSARDLYARDPYGHLLQLGTQKLSSTDVASLFVGRIHDIPPGAKIVRIDRITRDQWEAASRTFRFKGVPIRW